MMPEKSIGLSSYWKPSALAIASSNSTSIPLYFPSTSIENGAYLASQAIVYDFAAVPDPLSDVLSALSAIAPQPPRAPIATIAKSADDTNFLIPVFM